MERDSFDSILPFIPVSEFDLMVAMAEADQRMEKLQRGMGEGYVIREPTRPSFQSPEPESRFLP